MLARTLFTLQSALQFCKCAVSVTVHFVSIGTLLLLLSGQRPFLVLSLM